MALLWAGVTTVSHPIIICGVFTSGSEDTQSAINKTTRAFSIPRLLFVERKTALIAVSMVLRAAAYGEHSLRTFSWTPPCHRGEMAFKLHTNEFSSNLNSLRCLNLIVSCLGGVSACSVPNSTKLFTASLFSDFAFNTSTESMLYIFWIGATISRYSIIFSMDTRAT